MMYDEVLRLRGWLTMIQIQVSGGSAHALNISEACRMALKTERSVKPWALQKNIVKPDRFRALAAKAAAFAALFIAVGCRTPTVTEVVRLPTPPGMPEQFQTNVWRVTEAAIIPIPPKRTRIEWDYGLPFQWNHAHPLWPHVQFQVESSPDLAGWTTLGSTTNLFFDIPVNSPRSFFRVGAVRQ